ERLNPRFWVAAVLAFGGAAMVALGGGGGVSGQLWGDLLGFAAAATWAWYKVAVSPLLRLSSTLRISAFAFTSGSLPLLAVGSHQLATQDYGLGTTIWFLYVFAIVG